MYSPTYADIKAALQKELDLEDETFITPDELLNYANEGVDMIESAIHTIYEDYFLTNTTVSLVSGTQTYALPSDIYAQKIRAMYYDDGSAQKYELKRIKKLTDIPFIENPDLYQYVLTNSAAVGPRITFYPVPSETTTNIKLWYIRNAQRFTSDSDVCDIPEFSFVVTQYMRWKCMAKEGHPDTEAAAMALERMKQEMVDTLTARVPDEQNHVIPDYTFYSDYDDYIFGGNY